MASVRKKDRSPFYTACFQNEHGATQFRSTKTVNKKNALRIAHEWEDAWRKKATKDQAKVVLNDILELVGSDSIETMTLNQVFDTWLEVADCGALMAFLEEKHPKWCCYFVLTLLLGVWSSVQKNEARENPGLGKDNEVGKPLRVDDYDLLRT